MEDKALIGLVVAMAMITIEAFKVALAKLKNGKNGASNFTQVDRDKLNLLQYEHVQQIEEIKAQTAVLREMRDSLVRMEARQ